MRKHILITGGAGFMGSHLADELLRRDYRVRALDNLSPQVHGHGVSCAGRPDYPAPEVELMIGTAVDHVMRAGAELERKGLTL
jgi:dTDP-L-rhamnose 4-epimerase